MRNILNLKLPQEKEELFPNNNKPDENIDGYRKQLKIIENLNFKVLATGHHLQSDPSSGEKTENKFL